jgi:hypothetical protein
LEYIKERKALSIKRHKQESCIASDLREVVCEDMNWILLAQGTIQGDCEEDNESSNYVKFLEFLF